jgi:hypothetical protein
LFNDEIHVNTKVYYAKAKTDYIDPWNRRLQSLIWFDSESCFLTPILQGWGYTYYWEEPSQSKMFYNIFARQLSYMIHTTDTTRHNGK